MAFKPKRKAANTRDAELIQHDILLAMSKGHGFAASCRKADISDSYAYRLRRKEPSFDNEVKRILGSPLHRQRLMIAQASTEAGAKKDWRQQYVVQYRVTGDRNIAADAVEKSAIELENKLNPDHDDYDEELATLMKELEVRRMWQVEDEAWNNATVKNNVTMQKFLLQSGLPEKFGKPGKSHDSTTNNYWFSREHEANALQVVDLLVTGGDAKGHVELESPANT